MKWFIILLVLGGLGFAGYHFRDDIGEMFGKGKDKGADKQAGDKPGGKTTPPKTDPGGTKPTPPPKPPRDNNNVDPIAKKYPMPDFEPLDQLVDNWRDVPPSAFPREITLKAKAKYMFKGGVGSSTASAGSKTTALALAGGQLLIAPRPESTVRGQIPIDSTDFKQVLATAYDSYKDRKRKLVVAQRERARKLLADNPPPEITSSPSGPATISIERKPPAASLAEYEAKVGPMPKRDSSGRVALMVQSIKNRDVKEIKLNEINHWGPVSYEIVDGKPYWTGTVNYMTTSLFGTFRTEAMALMRNGQVDGWFYTGSLEEVP